MINAAYTLSDITAESFNKADQLVFGMKLKKSIILFNGIWHALATHRNIPLLVEYGNNTYL
jgi:hypothetical protein